MGRKIFISYKYGDTSVLALDNKYGTKVRDYVDKLQTLIDAGDHINKGEQDGQSLADFEDEAIASRLRDKIYDSSITVVLISKNMKSLYLNEKDQWMPWEISYSLKEHSRDGRTSLTNAVLAVVIPDEYGSYEYYITQNVACGSTSYNTPFLFGIVRENMFNMKAPDTKDCNGNTIFYGYHSYIHNVKWGDFITAIDANLDIASNINCNINNYTIVKAIR